MFVRITRPVTLVLYNHDSDAGADIATIFNFRPGQVLRVGELSPDGDTTTIEFLRLGYAEVPDDAWVAHEGVVLPFVHGRDAPPN